jgi:hypothetical protein
LFFLIITILIKYTYECFSATNYHALSIFYFGYVVYPYGFNKETTFLILDLYYGVLNILKFRNRSRIVNKKYSHQQIYGNRFYITSIISPVYTNNDKP